VITQRLVLDGGYPDGIYRCAGCHARLENGAFRHPDDCTVMAQAAAAERGAIIALAEQHQAWYVPECNPSECGPLCGTAAPFAYLIRTERP
jgi:hypothetical protein